MAKRSITIAVDQASMGGDQEWAHVGRFCELLEEALNNEYPNAEIDVRPERSTVNGGRVEIDGDWDGYASGGEDGIRAVVKHWSESIYQDGAWMSRKFQVEANGAVFGIYEAEDEQGARDACARDAGYKSEADMVKRLSAPSELVATEI